LSIADESEIRKLIANHFLLKSIMLQWRPAAGEDLPTPNTNEIVFFLPFFSVDLASRPAISYVDSLITIK
jgi:hypothetical protein